MALQKNKLKLPPDLARHRHSIIALSRTFQPIHDLGQPISYCRDSLDPAVARLLGALFHVSGSIDDLQVRDAQKASSAGHGLSR